MDRCICSLYRVPFGVRAFMLENLKYLNQQGGYKCYVVSSEEDPLTKEELGGVTFIPLEVKRGNVSPIEVLKCIYKLYKIFRKEKFTIIQYSTANISLYSCIAGWMAGIPVRVFCQWGVDYIDHHGFKRWFYKTMERITCMLSTHVQPDSFANLKFAIDEHLYKPSKGNVIYNGSACGVDLNRFDIEKKVAWKKEITEKFKLPKDKLVFGYVGRLALEKGINELLQAYLEIQDKNSVLMLVGPYYGVEALNQELYKKAQESENIVFVGPVSDAERYYATFDYLILPSHREGFGLVVLEAAAMGTPTIVSNIKGPTEFVKDNHNGLYFDVGSAESLKTVLLKVLSDDKSLKKRLSDNAYADVCRDFDSAIFKQKFLEDRNRMIDSLM